MHSDTSVAGQTAIVQGLMKRTGSGEVRWEASGNRTFTSASGGAVAVLELAGAPQRLRLRFHAVDRSVEDTVVEQPLPDEKAEKDEQYLGAMLRKLWVIVDGRTGHRPNAADLFLRAHQ